MKYCPDCKVLNEEDALVCKICGRKLDEKTKTITKTKTPKTKTKTKHKTKVKNNTKKVVKDKREKGRMNFIQKFFIFILFNLCIGLLGVSAYLAYHIYQNEYIDIPDVTGYTYESAEAILKEKKLNTEKIEKEVEDEKEVGIVLKQNKKGKASENQIIKLTVGVLKSKVLVPNVKGLQLDKAIELLNKNNVKYKIIYEQSDTKDIILNQNIKANTEIDKEEVLTLTVSKEIKKESKTENDKTEDSNNEQKDIDNKDKQE